MKGCKYFILMVFVVFAMTACEEEPNGNGNQNCTHNWSEWEETTPPTETEYGIDTRICDTCGMEQTKEGREPISSFGEIIITFTGIPEEFIGRKCDFIIAGSGWEIVTQIYYVDNNGEAIFEFKGEAGFYHLGILIEGLVPPFEYIGYEATIGNNIIPIPEDYFL